AILSGLQHRWWSPHPRPVASPSDEPPVPKARAPRVYSGSSFVVSRRRRLACHLIERVLLRRRFSAARSERTRCAPQAGRAIILTLLQPPLHEPQRDAEALGNLAPRQFVQARGKQNGALTRRQLRHDGFQRAQLGASFSDAPWIGFVVGDV